jgi:hypothetical protein
VGFKERQSRLLLLVPNAPPLYFYQLLVQNIDVYFEFLSRMYNEFGFYKDEYLVYLNITTKYVTIYRRIIRVVPGGRKIHTNFFSIPTRTSLLKRTFAHPYRALISHWFAR